MLNTMQMSGVRQLIVLHIACLMRSVLTCIRYLIAMINIMSRELQAAEQRVVKHLK
jgi:hypothetical protein